LPFCIVMAGLPCRKSFGFSFSVAPGGRAIIMTMPHWSQR
jgi:hypothetical protein